MAKDLADATQRASALLATADMEPKYLVLVGRHRYDVESVLNLIAVCAIFRDPRGVEAGDVAGVQGSYEE